MDWLQDLIYRWEVRLRVLESRGDKAFERKDMEQFGQMRDDCDTVRLHLKRLRALEGTSDD